MIDLPKWPAMVVSGESVTREQAAEILIRTNSWYVSTNDREWLKIILDIAGLKHENEDKDDCLFHIRQDWDDLDRFNNEMGILDLEYLGNSQIASCYIDGPHGWCHWSGSIHANSFNIGKWPKVDTVLEEWKEIAAAFPFLSLWCQLYSGETCEEGIEPVVEYMVDKGEAVLLSSPSAHTLKPYSSLDISLSTIGKPYRERGCTSGMLKSALEIVRKYAKLRKAIK